MLQLYFNLKIENVGVDRLVCRTATTHWSGKLTPVHCERATVPREQSLVWVRPTIVCGARAWSRSLACGMGHQMIFFQPGDP